MSTQTPPSAESSKRRKVTTARLAEMKARGEKIAMLTAYDFMFARILDNAGIDVVLVGDSAANVIHGFETSVPITLDQMISHAAAVVRGVRRALVVVDMPFGSYQGNSTLALESAVRVMKESGAHAVKMEGGEFIIDSVKRIVSAGIPVMGHLGLTPQSIYKFGTYVVRATTDEEAEQLVRDARLLQEAGCFAIVFEAIPAAVAEAIMPQMEAVVIGIGAGPATDGQVLVFHDLLGIREGLGARFVKRYASLQEEMDAGVTAFAEDVRSRRYPAEEHTYSIPDEELEAFRATAEIEDRLGSWEALEGF